MWNSITSDRAMFDLYILGSMKVKRVMESNGEKE